MNFNVQWYERLPSTNTFLREKLLAERELLSGTVVAAREQTHGRGRREREWLSSVGENLTFSLLLRHSSDPRRLPSAAMAAAVAVADLLAGEEVKPTLKWPNDVQVNGKKICGILSDGVAGHIIIGIGLNVNMQCAEHIDQPATSVGIETGKHYDIEQLLDKLLGHISVRLDEWIQGGFSGIRKYWEAHSPTLGKPISVRDGDTVRAGIFVGFGTDGELLLKDQSGRLHTVWSGGLCGLV